MQMKWEKMKYSYSNTAENISKINKLLEIRKKLKITETVITKTQKNLQY